MSEFKLLKLHKHLKTFKKGFSLKICLINPPMDFTKRSSDFEYSENFFTMQHLGLGYIASNLCKNRFETEIIECPMEDINIQQLVMRLDKSNYDIIGFSLYYYNVMSTIKIIKKLRQNKNRCPFIVVGGYFPTLRPEDAIYYTTADCIILGEGEETFVKLAHAIENSLDWKNIPGLGFMQNNQIKINEPSEAILELDKLPFPLRKVSEYTKCFSIITSRGCYNSCSFCGIREFYDKCCINRIRFRSVQNVIDEITELFQEYNPPMIKFSDEIFINRSINRKRWLQQFCNELSKKDYSINFNINVKATDVASNKDVLLLLKGVGLKYVFVGIESFSQRQLDYFNKNTSVQDNINALKVLKSLNIPIVMGFILLDPYSNMDEIYSGLKTLKELSVIESMDYRQFLFSSVVLEAIPGTPIYTNLSENNMLSSSAPGYHFVDRNVEKFYAYMMKWNEQAEGVNSKFYSLMKYEIEGLEIEDMLRFKHELLNLDLDYLISISLYINNEMKTEELFHSFLKKLTDLKAKIN